MCRYIKNYLFLKEAYRNVKISPPQLILTQCVEAREIWYAVESPGQPENDSPDNRLEV